MRASKYKPMFCKKLIEHQAKGFSFESFAGICDVNRDTLYEWVKAHQEFAEAKSIALPKCQLWWEKQAIDNLVEGDINVGVWAMNMRNRFGWRDKAVEDDTRDAAQVSQSTEEDVKKVLRLSRDRK